jgi:pimeloyl-ACP methyl ester carboxylesterase
LIVFTVSSADGTEVRAYDEGPRGLAGRGVKGPAIVLLHPGLDDGTRPKRVAAFLTPKYRVLRPIRRQYRLDLKPRTTTIADEVSDVVAVARALGGPVLLYGHSDGAVVALEALAAAPDAFAGAVIYEPAAVIDPNEPLAGKDGVVLKEARAQLAKGKPGKAMSVFFRHTIELPPWQAKLAALAVGLIPRYRNLVGAQLDSLEALDRLGVRLDTYSRITVPTVLLGGDSGPAHIARRLDAIAAVMPHARKVVMPGRDHGADLKAPEEVAAVIERLAEEVGLPSDHEVPG